VKCKTRGDTNNKRGNWDYFKEKYASNIPANMVKELQKIAILGTAHILREVLM